MLISSFTSITDRIPKARQIDWPTFAAELAQPVVVTDKAQAPCFSPAEFAPGTTRAKDNVIRLHMAVLDIDAIAHDALLKLTEDTLAPYGLAWHTTLSHSAKLASTGTWRVRLIMPLIRPVEVADWPQFWDALQSLVGGHADPQCKDPSRLYILPAHYPSDAPPIVQSYDDAPLDPGKVLAQTPKRLTNDSIPSSSLNPAQRIDLKTIRNRATNLSRDPERRGHAAALRAVAAGKPYGEPGRRHETMLWLTAELERMFPGASPQAIAETFAVSHVAMTRTDPDPPESFEQVAAAVAGIRAKRTAARAEAQAAQAILDRPKLADARGDGHPHPYTEEELQTIADMQGLSREELYRFWILRHRNTVHFLRITGYTEAQPCHHAQPIFAHYLSPVPNIPTERFTQRGTAPVPPDELMARYGMPVQHVEYDVRATYSRYSKPDSRLTIASAPRSQLTPTEHPAIHDWLTALGGAKADKFMRWLAAFPYPDELLCAVYMHGAAAVGKTVLGQALAKIWQYGKPTTFAAAVHRFNMPLAKCPFIVVDEGFPPLPHSQLAAELRTLIGGDTINLEEKFAGTYPLLGPRRMLLVANTDGLLNFKTELTHDDVEALTHRILQIQPDPKAKLAFKNLSRDEYDAWCSHRIAEHVLWLNATMQPQRVPGDRFIVSGDDAHTVNPVLLDSHFPSHACEVLAHVLTDKTRAARENPLIKWGNGKLLVNQQGLRAAWNAVFPQGPRPPSKLGHVLRSIAVSDDTQQLMIRDTAYLFLEIDLTVLYAWCERNGFAECTIRERIEAHTGASNVIRAI